MDMFKLLKDDHAKVKKQLEQILAKEDIDTSAVSQVCDELLLHMEMEEKFLYPVMQKQDDAQDITTEAIEEHKEARKVIEELSKGTLKATKLKVKVEILQLEIEHHVEEEENELFPKIKKDLSEQEINAIGIKMQELKAKKLEKQPARK